MRLKRNMKNYHFILWDIRDCKYLVLFAGIPQ